MALKKLAVGCSDGSLKKKKSVVINPRVIWLCCEGQEWDFKYADLIVLFKEITESVHSVMKYMFPVNLSVKTDNSFILVVISVLDFDFNNPD